MFLFGVRKLVFKSFIDAVAYLENELLNGKQPIVKLKTKYYDINLSMNKCGEIEQLARKNYPL